MNRSERPRSIKLFAVAFMAQAVASAAHNILTPADLQSRIFATFGTNDSTVVLFVLTLAFRLGLASLLTWLVYIRANSIAKWVATLFAIGRLTQTGVAWTGLQVGNPNSIAWLVTSAIALFAVVCLFLPDSRYWFASKGRSSRADSAIFE